jgi:hypothetical protein
MAASECAVSQVSLNAHGNADSPGLLVHEIPVAMPSFEE